jgi:hypothetical protein
VDHAVVNARTVARTRPSAAELLRDMRRRYLRTTRAVLDRHVGRRGAAMGDPMPRPGRVDVMLLAMLAPEAPAAVPQVFAFNNRIFHARASC